ncbi:MAG: type II toxin-antitoxin system RelE/ParE family toxin [Nitrospirae bacterium]|nr:type II toxin-antitoxin system RelE/ParE family toxin [Nitrospirota bacterium]
MTYELRYHPDVKKHDLPLINKKLRERIKKAIEERLLVSPEQYGEPLRKTLKRYWKMRVGDYRVVFKITGQEILILGIRHRKEVYQIVEGRI